MDAPKERINLFTGGIMVGAAVLIDLAQFFLDVTVLASILSAFLGILADFTFFLWFKMVGVEYSGKGSLSKIIAMGGMSVISIIPLLDGVPELTAGVSYIVFTTMAEDRLKKKEWEKKLKATGKTRQQIMYIQQQRIGAQQAAANDNAQEGYRAANDNIEEEYRAAA